MLGASYRMDMAGFSFPCGVGIRAKHPSFSRALKSVVDVDVEKWTWKLSGGGGGGCGSCAEHATEHCWAWKVEVGYGAVERVLYGKAQWYYY